MILSRIHLSGFRAFLDVDVDLERTTVLVGPNGAGKSTIIQAVDFLLSSSGHRWDETYELYAHRSQDLEKSRRPIVVTGELTALAPGEEAMWEPFLVDGKVRIGAYREAYVDLLEDPPARTCVLIPDDRSPALHQRRDMGHLRTRGEPDVVWSHEGFDWYLPRRLVGFDGKLGPFLFDLRLPSLAWLRGVEAPLPEPAALLKPFLDSAIDTVLDLARDEVAEEIDTMAFEVINRVGNALAGILPKYVEGATGAALHRPGWDSSLLREALEAVIGDLEVRVAREPFRPLTTDTIPPTFPGGTVALSDLGGGSQRAARLAMIELYLDPHLQPKDAWSVILALEEPELGLHPSAQRRVAEALRLLPDSGIQTIVATHSPIIVNSTPSTGIRLVEHRPDGGREVTRPSHLDEVREVLGATAADVLLGDCFVAVEGPIDAAVFKTWARLLGADWDALGVRVFPAGGNARVANLTQFLEVVYAGAEIHVIVDGGKQSAAHIEEIRERFGDRVTAHLLGRPLIEAYYEEDAICGWLADAGVQEPKAAFRDLPEGRPSKRALHDIAQRLLGREYRPVADDVAIAGKMTEATIAPEIKGILSQIAAR